jgi:hypothetical protein
MQELVVDLSFISQVVGSKSYKKSFFVENDLDYNGWDYLAGHMFRECQMETLYRTYRQQLPSFDRFSDAGEWSPSQAAVSDLTRWAAHTNTAEAWFQIQNAFFETAHLLAQSRAYHDIETEEADEDRKLLIHLVKIQFFNSAAYLISKVEDLFFVLLFVNSGCSLIPMVDVDKEDWQKEISRGAIHRGLRSRKSQLCCGSFRKTNPYLEALTDEEYRTIRSVFKKLGSAKPVRTIRNYRNAIAHRGPPAVDYSGFSPAFRFPKKDGQRITLGVGGRPKVEYQFLQLYDDATLAVKHLETQLRRIKDIPVLVPR